MKRLIQCANCGKITSLTRSDKLTCSNACAVKLIYARNHNFQTPFEAYLSYIETEENTLISEGMNNNIVESKKNIKNDSELDEKLKKYNLKLKTI